jgi:hypothetical protein
VRIIKKVRQQNCSPAACTEVSVPIECSTSPSSEEYLTVADVAARLKLTKKSIQNKMAAGIFRKGVHYFKPIGLSPRFKWSAVVDWLENTEKLATECGQESIPMARGYVMRIARKK